MRGKAPPADLTDAKSADKDHPRSVPIRVKANVTQTVPSLLEPASGSQGNGCPGMCGNAVP